MTLVRLSESIWLLVAVLAIVSKAELKREAEEYLTEEDRRKIVNVKVNILADCADHNGYQLEISLIR